MMAWRHQESDQPDRGPGVPWDRLLSYDVATGIRDGDEAALLMLPALLALTAEGRAHDLALLTNVLSAVAYASTVLAPASRTSHVPRRALTATLERALASGGPAALQAEELIEGLVEHHLVAGWMGDGAEGVLQHLPAHLRVLLESQLADGGTPKPSQLVPDGYEYPLTPA